MSPAPPAALTESAVLVQVPAAEPLVSRHRARLDSAAELGVPAHVTILSPFVPPSAVTSSTLAILAEAVAPVAELPSLSKAVAPAPVNLPLGERLVQLIEGHPVDIAIVGLHVPEILVTAHRRSSA